MRRRARQAEERLDAPVHDERELEQSLDQVAAVNRFLGGTRAVLRTVDACAPATGPIRVLDVGCGSGDVMQALLAHGAHRGRRVLVTATDIHPQILAIAQRRLAGERDVRFARVDAHALPFRDATFDIVTMSLTLHHFEEDEPVAILRELARVAHVVIVNDLERSWPNYVGARALGLTLWAGNRLTRHDGPLSVLRSFTASELAAFARRAGLRDVEVRRRFFYRLVMTARSSSAAARSTVA